MLKQIPMIFLVAKVIILFVCASLHSCNSEGRTNLPKIVSVPTLITFGDSFVDQGNNNYIAALGKSNHPPYGKDFVGGKATGRFSNGKTFADFFTEGLGVKEYLPAYLDPSIQDNDLLSGVSFASGGSGYDSVTPKLSLAIPLWDQLDLFKQYIGRLEMNVGQEEATKIITNSVFLVVASTNDLMLAYPLIRRSEYDVPTYNSILLNLTLSFVQELYELGARKIGVFGAPPVGCFPVERTLVGGFQRMCVDDRNEAAQLYSSMLEEQLPILASNLPQSRVAFVDFYNPLISAIDNPQQYGLEVIDRGCCGTGLLEVVYLCNKFSLTCKDDSKFLFWDSIHLSEIGCSIFANQTLPGLINSLF